MNRLECCSSKLNNFLCKEIPNIQSNITLTNYDKKKFNEHVVKGQKELLSKLPDSIDFDILNSLDDASFEDEIGGKIQHIFQNEHIDEFVNLLIKILEKSDILDQVNNSLSQYLVLMRSSTNPLDKILTRHRRDCIKIIQEYDELIKNVCYLCNMVYEIYYGTNIYTFMIFVMEKLYKKLSFEITDELELENIPIRIHNSILVFYDIALKYYDNGKSKSEYLDQVETYDTLFGTLI